MITTVKTTITLFAFIIALVASATAFAWEVDCGDKTIYYSNGSVLVSSGGTVYFKNGNVFISNGGTIYYMNGNVFKSSGDTVYYENGNVLKSNGGTYYYSNGNVARSSGGTMYLENGNVTSIPFAFYITPGELITAKVVVPGGTSSGSNIILGLDAGAGQYLSVTVGSQGLSCEGLADDIELSVDGKAATAKLKIKPGFDAARVKAAVQKALDNL